VEPGKARCNLDVIKTTDWVIDLEPDPLNGEPAPDHTTPFSKSMANGRMR
jgi:hypothetical protein